MGLPSSLSPGGGLSSDEARARLEKSGPNEMPDTAMRPWRMALAKFWAPVPWMLEAAVVLQLVLHEYVEAAVIAGLLVFNAALGFFQEGRAQATLAALKSRLALTASVRRDGAWKNIPASGLVPGDTVKLSLGGVVAADVKLVGGSILLDQSMLTGESVPIEAGPGLQTYAGALVRRGEATAIVTATGARTKFGHTAELVRTAHVVSTQQKTVVRVVRNLAIFNGVLIALAGDVRARSQDAGRRHHPSRAHGRPGVHPRRSARHVHPGRGARREGPGARGRAAHPVVRRGRGGHPGRALLGQDGDVDAQRPDRHRRSAPSPASMSRTSWRWPLSRAPTAGRIPWTPPSARPPRSRPSPIRRS